MQVLWLIERRRYRQAMDAVLGAAYVRPETSAACSAAFLDHLVTTGQFAGAPAHYALSQPYAVLRRL